MAEEQKKAIEFALYSRRNGEGYDKFEPIGLWINTKGATASDYIAFIQGVCDHILTFAKDELEAEANRQGRTLTDRLKPIFGSKPIQIADEAVNVDSVGVATLLNEELSD